MRIDPPVDHLSRNLRPVRRLVELAAFLGTGFTRPDMPAAMQAPSFLWRLASLGLIAVLGAGVAIVSADLVRSPRHGLRWILLRIAAAFASGWLIGAMGRGFAELLLRLDWRQGLRCVRKIVALSVPRPSPWDWGSAGAGRADLAVAVVTAWLPAEPN